MLQITALFILKLGHTTFLTGEAGSGKSYVLREYISYLKSHRVPYAVTASTGIAATHINGQTIHSWSGLGVREYLSSYDLDLLEEKQPLYKKWNSVSVLIIDEVSMLSAHFINMLDTLAKHMRRNTSPFGGLQVVFCGDFFQLPPISKKEAALYAYTSDAWAQTKPVICYLTEQHRQGEDTLTQILKEIRTNDITETTYEALKERLEIKKKTDTKLYTHNADVDFINKKAFDAISGEEYNFTMVTKGKAKDVAMLTQNCLAEEILSLKKGVKVMCIKNDINKQYVNGSLGVVDDFDRDGFPIIKLNSGGKVTIKHDTWKLEDEGKVRAEISQIPLKLAWAITIHKSQGMTLDEAEIDLSKVFTAGMGYVALSRLRSIEGLFLSGFNNQALLLSPEVREIDAIFVEKSKQAENALIKYDDESLAVLHTEALLRLGGNKEVATEEAEEDLEQRVSTYEETKNLISQNKTIAEIAKARTLTVDTIVGHIEKLTEKKISLDLAYIVDAFKEKNEIVKHFKKEKEMRLAPVFEKTKGIYDYTTLRLVRAWIRQQDLS